MSGGLHGRTKCQVRLINVTGFDQRLNLHHRGIIIGAVDVGCRRADPCARRIGQQRRNILGCNLFKPAKQPEPQQRCLGCCGNERRQRRFERMPRFIRQITRCMQPAARCCPQGLECRRDVIHPPRHDNLERIDIEPRCCRAGDAGIVEQHERRVGAGQAAHHRVAPASGMIRLPAQLTCARQA